MPYFKLFRSAVCAALCLTLVAHANAAPISWSLVGVTFDDGGSLSGTFIIDTGKPWKRDFTLTELLSEAGPVKDGKQYYYSDELCGPPTRIPCVTSLSSSSFSLESKDGVSVISLSFEHPFFLSGDRDAPAWSPVGVVGGFEENLDGTDRRLVMTGGFATVVPEPETYAMLLAGLGMLGFTVRRKKDNAA